jgi:hypothetical protein
MIPSIPGFEFELATDLPTIAAYNSRRNARTSTWIHTEVTPCPFEGRLGAPLTWLLSNPQYVQGGLFNEPPPITKGWPLQSLAPAHRHGYGAWTMERVATLVADCGLETVARNVLVVQVSGWASESFDAGLILPSRALTRRIVLHQIRSGSIFVLVRSRRLWRHMLPELESSTVIETRTPRSAHLTPGNLSPSYELVRDAVNRP